MRESRLITRRGGVLDIWGEDRRGFTLSELLLVIAIIAILAAILFPVLLTSKRLSYAAKCASNMHQLGKAFQLYLSDWNGVYPSPGGKMGDYNYWSQSGRGGLVGYVRSVGGVATVWCCPVQRRWTGKYAARTYSMNSYLRNPPDAEYPSCTGIFRGCEECVIEAPRRTILLYEGLPVTPSWPDSQDYIYRCGNWSCVRGWYLEKNPCQNTIDSWLAWHGLNNNYLYCDGHVRSRRPARYAGKMTSTPGEMSEWYVKKTEHFQKYGY